MSVDIIKEYLKKLSPSRKLILGFLLAILVGTFLLMMPFSLKEGEKLSFLSSLFTIVSAVCVTGLTVVDVSKVFSPVGTTIIIFFIQLGGLGVMTFSSIIFLATGKKMTFYERELLKEERNADSSGEIADFIKKLLFIVFIIESIGAVILTTQFIGQMSFWKAIYYGIFHSISAFCNAGFDILGGSNFADYIFHPFFNLILLIEVVCGGLGFAVLLDIYQKRKWQKLSINSKLVLVTTGFLILIGSVFIFILEYGNQNTLGDLGLFDKVMVSTFMASMARTSGFSMLDIGSLTEPSLLLIMFLMFIGGSPASTGGGIKTTTIAVIFAAIWSLIRGREDVVIFERTVPPIVIFRAMSIFFVSAIVVFLMSMFLCLTEDIALSKILFESVSMFATVGLPTGTINEMDASSRIVIIFVMLMGRIGIISFAMALVIRKKKNKIRYPEDKFIIG